MSKFHWRGFISILLSLAFLVVVLTGLVLWLSHSPQTFGIGKGVWKHAHISISLVMLISGSLHLWLNWSCYWCYLWNTSAGRLNRKWELIAAVAIIAFTIGSAAIGDHNGLGPMEAITVLDIAKKTGKPVEEIVAKLEAKGIKVTTPSNNLLAIMQRSNMPPKELFEFLEREYPEVLQSPHGH